MKLLVGGIISLQHFNYGINWKFGGIRLIQWSSNCVPRHISVP
jgi:hypothetical protein